MTHQLPIPEELQHLIEKRSGRDRRKSTSQCKGPGPSDASAHSTPADPAHKPPESRPDGRQERRSGRDRRRSQAQGSKVQGPKVQTPKIDPSAGSGEAD